MHTSMCTHLQSVCARAHFLRLLCLLITVKRRQLETETHQGIKGISVGWCVTELNHCLLFWYVLWFRKHSKEDVGATRGRLPGSVNTSHNYWWSGSGCLLYSNSHSVKSFSIVLLFYCLLLSIILLALISVLVFWIWYIFAHKETWLNIRV